MNPENKTALTIQDVATRFDQLAQQEKWFEIQDELFADNVRSIEPPTAKHLKNAEGKAAVRKKAEDWVKRIEALHGSHTTPSVIGGHHFAVGRTLDVTVRGLGRMKMDEVMVYEVKDGRIVLEQFFY
jgi:ketosteroid isomerase-like protein